MKSARAAARCSLLLVVGALSGCAASESGGTKGPLVPFGPAGLTRAAVGPVRRALLVGIDAFEDERFSPLRYAGKDARALAGALEGFEDLTVLTGSSATSRSRILSELHALTGRVSHPEDTVLVYFSTHGSLDRRRPSEDLERFVIASDSRLDLVAQTAIPVRDVIDTLARTETQRLVLILAACHSGGGKSRIPDALGEALRGLKSPAIAPIESVSEASFVLSAAAFGEAAREDDQLGHDVYTHFLLQALRVGDRDRDGAVTVSEAHDSARAQTYLFTGGRQRPTAESVILGVDPIVLAGNRSRTALPTIFSYAPSAEGLVIAIDGVVKGTLPGGVAVDAGRRRLELREAETGTPVYDGTIDVVAGERTDLSRLLPRSSALGAHVGPAVFIPLSSSVRDRYFPASFGLRLALRADHVLLQRSVLELGTDLYFGAGRVSQLASELPFGLVALRPGLRMGFSVPFLDAFSLDLTAGAGALLAWRSFETPTFQARESLVGPWLAGRVSAHWTPHEVLGLGAELESGAFWGRLGEDSGAHAFLSGSILAGARF